MCCLKIFEKKFHRGAKEILPIGHRGEFDLENFQSYRFIDCAGRIFSPLISDLNPK